VVDPVIRNRNVVNASYRFEYSAYVDTISYQMYEPIDIYNTYTLVTTAPIRLWDFYSGASISFYALGGNLTYKRSDFSYFAMQ
jgi:hypothetical protein